MFLYTTPCHSNTGCLSWNCPSLPALPCRGCAQVLLPGRLPGHSAGQRALPRGLEGGAVPRLHAPHSHGAGRGAGETAATCAQDSVSQTWVIKGTDRDRAWMMHAGSRALVDDTLAVIGWLKCWHVTYTHKLPPTPRPPHPVYTYTPPPHTHRWARTSGHGGHRR